MQSCTCVIEEGYSNESYDESFKPDLSADENLDFLDLIASAKSTISRPPLADIIERPKSSLPTVRVSPLKVSLGPPWSLFPAWMEADQLNPADVLHPRRGRLNRSVI
jgi:hypothetical protein